MGNIVTPDQGLLPLPTYALAATPYPWWLTAALAIWALLALLCCWLLLLLYLLRYCCKWWRHRKYAADRQSLRKRFLGRGAAVGERGAYVTKDQHFATAPLPPVPPYASSGEVFESQIVEDEFFGNRMPYVTAAAVATDNAAFSADSESVSEEEIIRGKKGHRGGGGGVITRVDEVIRAGGGARRGGGGVITQVDEVIRTGGGGAARAGGMNESLETNVERNITKNYYINEEQNYFIQNEPAVQHDQVIQSLPAPTITTVNMAAERVADNPNWENTNTREDFNRQPTKQASAEIVAADPSLFRQDVRYERPPNILTHRPVTPEAPRLENRKLPMQTSIISEDSSSTSEMSGHDSESIYETIRVLKPKTTILPRADQGYRTAGVDEVEIEMRGNPKTTTTYEEFVSSSNVPRQNVKRRGSSSLSSSSTLNNLASNQSQANNFRSAEDEKEETVTETIKTEQVQTTYRQIGQNLDGSAFFIPLTHQEEEQSNEERIVIPITTSSIHYEEQPALQQFKNNDQ